MRDAVWQYCTGKSSCTSSLCVQLQFPQGSGSGPEIVQNFFWSNLASWSVLTAYLLTHPDFLGGSQEANVLFLWLDVRKSEQESTTRKLRCIISCSWITQGNFMKFYSQPHAVFFSWQWIKLLSFWVTPLSFFQDVGAIRFCEIIEVAILDITQGFWKWWCAKLMQVEYKPMTTQVNWRTDYDSQSGKSSTTGEWNQILMARTWLSPSGTVVNWLQYNFIKFARQHIAVAIFQENNLEKTTRTIRNTLNKEHFGVFAVSCFCFHITHINFSAVDGLSSSRAGSDEKLCHTPESCDSDPRGLGAHGGTYPRGYYGYSSTWSEYFCTRCCQCSFWIKYCLFTINFFVWVRQTP